MGWTVKRLNEFHWGHFVVAKIQWVISVTILLKLFDAAIWMYFAFPIIAILCTWLLGFLMEKTGFRLRFVQQSFDGTNVK